LVAGRLLRPLAGTASALPMSTTKGRDPLSPTPSVRSGGAANVQAAVRKRRVPSSRAPAPRECPHRRPGICERRCGVAFGLAAPERVPLLLPFVQRPAGLARDCCRRKPALRQSCQKVARVSFHKRAGVSRPTRANRLRQAETRGAGLGGTASTGHKASARTARLCEAQIQDSASIVLPPRDTCHRPVFGNPQPAAGPET
jgi:hypothetical protein